MNLPQNLQHFPHPALLIATDHQKARFFLVGGDSMEELDGIDIPREKPTDNEGKMFVSDVHDEPRLKEFVHAVIAMTEKLVKDHGIAHLNLVMPAEVEHLMTKHLSKSLNEKVMRRVHLDLIQESPLTIVKRVLEEGGMATPV